MITVEEYFDDDDLTIRATFHAENMADAISCPAEHASRYAGQFSLELHACVNADTGEEHEPTPYQLDALEQKAMRQIREPLNRGWWED